MNAYPLSWPEGWKRTPAHQIRSAHFNNYGKRLTVNDGVMRVLRQLEMMGVDRNDVIISTNLRTRLDGMPRSDQAEPSDRGAAVYWVPKGQPSTARRCMAIDCYTLVADNLAAIAATLEAMRAIERHGGAQILERAFLGFAALPEKAGTPWRDVLGIHSTGRISIEAIEARFRELAKKHHSDIPGGDDDRMRELLEARDAARQEIDQLKREAS